MKKLIIAAFACVVLAHEVCATQYSCLSIITAAKQAGKWEAVKAWIDAAGLADEWGKCHYVSDDYPQYATITNALVAAGVATDAEIKAILAASVDTAIPDELLNRVYQQDMSSHTGRVRWHGKVVRSVIDTNALTRTQYHTDGWVYTEKFKAVANKGIDAKLSAAERAAKREAAEQARLAAIRQEKVDRLAKLESHPEIRIAELCKEYPALLAGLLYTNEVNKLQTELGKTVTVTITPQ